MNLNPVPRCYKCKQEKPTHHYECADCRNVRTLEYKRNGHWSKTKPNEKRRARVALVAAVRNGKIVKPQHCEKCGRIVPPIHLHGHHSDYAKRLEVQWLCRKCHNNLNLVSVLAEPTEGAEVQCLGGEARESNSSIRTLPETDSRGGIQNF